MIDFSKKRVLIIDDSQAMASSLRMTLTNFGMTRSEMANTAGEALFRIRNREFDMIVCDYNLGEGTDGQQLLETLRRQEVILPSVVFLMVTAERQYEKVVLCAEMAPDDYLLKPFTAETMRVRLERVFEKKEAFAPIYHQLVQNDIGAALAACDTLLVDRTRYVIDVMRMKGELLLELGREEEAQQLYEQILATRAVPWARLGLARAMRATGELDAANDQLQLAIEEMPEFLPAYDLLAKVEEEQGDTEKAQQTLDKAIKVSPGNVTRQTAFGEVAYRNGDLTTAAQAFGRVVESNRNAFMRSPQEYVNLGRIQLEQQQFDKALQTLNGARSVFGDDPQMELSVSTMESLTHQVAGNADKARDALDRALAARDQARLNLGDATALDLAKACFLNGKEDEARALVKEMTSNFYDDTRLQQSVRQMLKSVGREHESKSLVEDSAMEVVKLNNEGVLLARQGNLQGAIDLLLEASHRMPQNIQLALNAAQAMIVESDRYGWNAEHMKVAQQLLAAHETRYGKLDKFKKIKVMMKDVGAKFGVDL